MPFLNRAYSYDDITHVCVKTESSSETSLDMYKKTPLIKEHSLIVKQ